MSTPQKIGVFPDQNAHEVEQKLAESLNSLPANAKEENYLEVGVRPWGVYYVMEDKANYKVKKIVVNSNQRLSLQNHQHRSEHWIVVSGTATVEIEDIKSNTLKVLTLSPNESCFIPMTAKHRLSNRGKIPLILIEVQLGEYTGEDDIERYEDDYARVS